MLTGVKEVEKSTIAVLKNLDVMEITWTQQQKELKKQWLKESLKKKVRSKDLIDQVLMKCKDHGGPLTSVTELKAIVTKKSPDLKSFLRQELQYQRLNTSAGLYHT